MLIDTNIFVEVLLAQRNAERCARFLEKVHKGEIRAHVSTFTIDGVLLNIERNRKTVKDLARFLYHLLSYRTLMVYTPTLRDRLNAFAHMDAFKLDFDDALILQCALSNNIKEIVSFDKHFDKVKMIKRIEPS